MRNAGLEEAQAETKISRRNVKNLRFSDDTTLMAKSEEDLKSLFMNVQFSSVAQSSLFVTPWTTAGQGTLSITNC